MFRFAWRVRRTKRYIRKLLKFYNYISSFNKTGFYNYYKGSLYTNIHIISIPKRQQYFTFLKNYQARSLNFSGGYILNALGYKIKYFKRSYTSSAILVLFFRHYYLHLFQYIYIYYFKNFNYRQYYFFKKLTNSIKINIYYLLHRKSYIPRFITPRRIKRRVLRIVAKQ